MVSQAGMPAARRKLARPLLVLVASVLLAVIVSAPALGAREGALTLSIGGGADGRDAVEAGGKITVAGGALDPNTDTSDFALARFDAATGALDPAFGGDGIVTTPISPPGRTDRAFAITREADGQLVVAGSAEDAGGGENIALARYNSDGTLDTSGFGGGDGIVTTPVAPAGGDDSARDVAVEPSDGSIIVVGQADMTANSTGIDSVIAKYNAAGTLDPSFDGDGAAGNGIVVLPLSTVGGAFDGLLSVALQPADGKIVAAGSARIDAVTGDDFVVVRLGDSDGKLDDATDSDPGTTFFGGGIARTAIASGAGRDTASAVAIQPGDGKILAAGLSAPGGSFSDFSFARYNADGSLDTAFDGPAGNGDGRFRVQASTTRDDNATDIALQGDGKIVAAGNVSLPLEQDFAAMRLNPSGTLDDAADADPGVTFDGDGIASADASTSDRGNAVGVLSGGNVFIAGDATIGNTNRIVLVMLSSTGALVPAFNSETVAPDTTITKRPRRRTTKRKVTFAFASNEAGSSFDCSLDGALFEQCTSPVKERLSRGKHTFQVQATDMAENLDPEPAEAKFKIIRR
jgi:uncharacterized delta-60 repeat protein